MKALIRISYRNQIVEFQGDPDFGMRSMYQKRENQGSSILDLAVESYCHTMSAATGSTRNAMRDPRASDVPKLMPLIP